MAIALNGIIIRNDHDELLILLERANMKNQIIINYDRHSDMYKNPHLDVGSWGYYGKKYKVINKLIWIPPNENIFNWIRIKIAKRRLSKIKKPVVLSICYDYLCGLNMKTSWEEIRGKIKDISDDIRKYGLSVLFIYASRSIEWCDESYIRKIDRIILDEFVQYGFHQSNLSQKCLLGRPKNYDFYD
jgi:hypothetical protein